MIVAHSETSLPLPVLGVDEDTVNIEVEAEVLQRTVVGELRALASDVAHGFEGEQVHGLGIIEVQAERQTVFEHSTLQTDVEAMSRLPRQFGVGRVGKHKCREALQIGDALKVRAACIIVDGVVATHIIAQRELEVVDGGHVEPLLGTDEPTCLDGGEETPLHTSKFDTALGLLTEARAALHRGRDGEEIEVLVVVVGIGIPGDATPLVLVALHVAVLEGVVNVGHLVVVVVVDLEEAAGIRVGRETHSAEQVEPMGIELLAPVYTEVVEDDGRLGEL